MNLGSPQEPPCPHRHFCAWFTSFHGIRYECDLGTAARQAGEEGVPELPEEMDQVSPESSTFSPQ